MISFKESVAEKNIQIKLDLENNAVVVESGKSSILCVVSVSEDELENKSFSASGFKPLTVCFESRFNAINKIPGGFKKRDLPSDQDIIISRLIDRSIRPLLPNEFNREVKICIYVYGYHKGSLEVLSVLGASLLLNILGILDAPVSLCKISGDKINNSNFENSKFKFLAAFSGDQLVMADYECMKDISLKSLDSYKNVLDKAFKITASLAQEFHDVQNKIIAKVQVNKVSFGSIGFLGRLRAWKLSRTIFNSLLVQDYPKLMKSVDSMDYTDNKNYVFNSYLRELLIAKLSAYVLKNKQRINGRSLVDGMNLQIASDIRETIILKDLVHSVKGSCLLSRGKTKVYTSLAIGDEYSAQCIDTIDSKENELFWVNYNFLPGHKTSGRKDLGLSRREIGHSDLIKRAIRSLYTDRSKVARVVCDVISADGGTSMLSVCAASLLLYKHQLISSLVAGISVGLIRHESKKSFFIDLTHLEDELLSSVDCKIAGSRDEITVMQLDVKKSGVTHQEFNELLKIAVVKLNEVLDVMEEVSFDEPENKAVKKRNMINNASFFSKDKVKFESQNFETEERKTYERRSSDNFHKRERKIFAKNENNEVDSNIQLLRRMTNRNQSKNSLDKENSSKYPEKKMNYTKPRNYQEKEITNVSSKNYVEKEKVPYFVDNVKSNSLALDVNIQVLEIALKEQGLTIFKLAKDFDVFIKIEGSNKLTISSKNHQNILKSIKLIRSLMKG